MKEIVIGIDIGGTYTKFGAVDRSGASLAEDSIPTSEHEKAEDFVSRLAEKINAMLAGLPRDLGLKGIGIGVPNGNFFRGTVEFAPNLRWKGIVPLAEIFRNHFDLPVYLTNDANAAALGEMIYGGARGMKDFVLITLGTGLGSGIVVNGQMVYGHDGFAGELGHTIVDPAGRECGCGKRGCLETYVSATGIRRTVFELMAEYISESSMRNISFNDLTARMISEAAEKGDSLALEAFERTGRILAMKLADTVAHVSPQAIFLFGGLAGAGDLILEPVRRHLEEYLLPIYRGKVRILPSQLSEINAAIAGAGALVWNALT